MSKKNQTIGVAASLRLPQVRILKALASGGLFTRARINEKCGFSPQSGTITSALNGVREGSSSGPARPGLISLGLISKEDIDVDGLVETCYRLTLKGRTVLDSLAGSAADLPELRDKASSTNQRYKNAGAE